MLSVLIPHEMIEFSLPVFDSDAEIIELLRDIIVVLLIITLVLPSLNLTLCYVVKISGQVFLQNSIKNGVIIASV